MASNYNVAKATANQVGQAQQPFSTFMKNVGIKLVANTITDSKRKTQFIANLVSAVSNNPTLQDCDQVSVVAAALQAEALHFPINNALGYVYLVPFNDKNSGMKKAQFQIGYKGYIQLAIRSGQYKSLEVTDVREGELAKFNPLTGQEFNWKDYSERISLPVIGYVARLELVNGFSKEIYWTYEKMLDHADKYSQAFSKNAVVSQYPKKCKVSYDDYLAGNYPKEDEWKYSSFWYKDWQEMAYKTMLRQLLSKWGIMSVEMQEAFINDQAAFDENEKRDYIDSQQAFNNVAAEQDQQMGAETPNYEDAPTTPAQDSIPDWMND